MGFFCKESRQTKIKNEQFPSMQIDKYRTFAKECVIKNSEIFSYEKCINIANSSFNLYVLYIKLAQNTKQFRRLVLGNFITAIHLLFR